MGRFDELTAFLDDVRRRVLRAALVEAGMAAAWSLLAIGACTLWLARSSENPRLLAAVGAAGAFAALAVVVWTALRPVRDITTSPSKLARYVEQRVPGLFNGLVTSVELFGRGAPASEGVTASLAQGVLNTTSRRLRGVSAAALVDAGRAVAHGKVFASVAALALLAGLLEPTAYRAGWAAITAPAPQVVEPPPVTERTVESAARNIRLRYVYPAYMQRADRTVPGTGGDVLAPAGTVVYLDATAVEPAAQAFIDVGESEPVALALEVNKDGALSGMLTVTEPTVYRVRLTTPEGVTVRERAARSVDIEPDEPPDVELLLPEADLELNADDSVNFAFRTRDDHGIDSVEVVFQVSGKGEPSRRRVLSAQGKQSAQSDWTLELGETGAKAGDRVEVWFEASDLNSVGGPGIGTSETRVIKVWSPLDKHEEVVDSLAALAQEMLELLADRLESPVDAREAAQYDVAVAEAGSVSTATQRLVEAFGAVIVEAEADSLMPEEVVAELIAMRSRHDELQRAEQHTLERIAQAPPPPSRFGELLALLGGHNDAAVEALEDDIMKLEDMVERLRQDMLKEKTKDLLAQQEELMKMLEELAKSGDTQLAAQAMQQLDALQQQLDQMMQDLAKQIQEMPAENFNKGALEPEETQKDVMDFQKQLDAIKEMLKKGDVEGAMKAAAELQKAMAEMMAKMDEGFEGFGGMGMSGEQRQRLQEMEQKVSELAREEQQLYEETSEMVEKLDEALRQQMKEKLQAFVDEQKQRAKELQEKLEQAKSTDMSEQDQQKVAELRQKSKDIEMMLERFQLAPAKREAEETAGECDKAGSQMSEASRKSGDINKAKEFDKSSKKLGEARDLAQQIADDIANAMPDPREMMSEQDKQKLDELRQRQGKTRERLQQLQQQAGEQGGDMPGMQEMLQQMLDEARESMQGAEGGLGGQKPGEAQGQEQAALEKLGQAQRKMQSMLKPGKRGSSQGAGTGDERTGIPKAEDYEVPEEMRGEIMKAAKEAAPSGYRSEIQKYYEGLIK
jgi:hypothetical protein